MWIPPQTTIPPRRERASASGHERADGGEDDRRVELLRRRPREPPAQYGAELAREGLRRSSPARVNANTSRPSERQTCVRMCAAAPKP